MKIWMHIGAAVLGFAMAGVIVYIVFGNASRNGASQDGAAPGGLDATGGTLCGTYAPAAVGSAKSRAASAAHPPSVVQEDGRQIQIQKTALPQVAWLTNLHAAGGLCVDEVKITDTSTTISMSTTKSVDAAAAGAYAAGALFAAFQSPLQRATVDEKLLIGDQTRTLHMTARAYRAWVLWQRSHHAAPTVASLLQFRRQVSFRPADLRIAGWS